MIQFFGERWDAPQVDPPAVQVSTPTSQSCFHCGEPIEDGDRGLLRAVVRAGGVDVEPVHMECDLRMGLGGMDHLTGRCSCMGSSSAHGAPAYATARAEALAVLDWWNQRRAGQGQQPL